MSKKRKKIRDNSQLFWENCQPHQEKSRKLSTKIRKRQPTVTALQCYSWKLRGAKSKSKPILI